MSEAETRCEIYRRVQGYTAKARAFTMLELLLVMVILMVLIAVAWPNLGGRSSGGRLELTAQQLGALLQMARSQAMNTGNSYRCRFDQDGLRAIIEEETDPFTKPGVFEIIPAGWASLDLGVDNIKCVAVQFDPWETQLREQEAKVLESDSEDDKEWLSPPIMFNPDGTCDTVAVLLGNAEKRNYTVTLNGLTGQIKVAQGDLRQEVDNQTDTTSDSQTSSERGSNDSSP